MKDRIILVGAAGSGKDFARVLFQQNGFEYGVSYTTRPPREKEVEGEDYFFITEEDFKNKEKNNFFCESIKFNDWHYGTANWQFYGDTEKKASSLFIMTPKGISNLKLCDRINSTIIFFDIHIHIRMERLLKRNDIDKVERRIMADEQDFLNFKDYDITITDANFKWKSIASLLNII